MTTPDLIDGLQKLYAYLKEKQEPLGEDFQKVIDDNRSELLARW